MVPKWSVFFKDKWWTRLGSGSITSLSEVWQRKRFQFACCCLISQWQKVESVPNNGVQLLTLRIPCREWVELFSGSGSTLVKQLLLTSFHLKTSPAFSGGWRCVVSKWHLSFVSWDTQHTVASSLTAVLQICLSDFLVFVLSGCRFLRSVFTWQFSC